MARRRLALSDRAPEVGDVLIHWSGLGYMVGRVDPERRMWAEERGRWRGYDGYGYVSRADDRPVWVKGG